MNGITRILSYLASVVYALVISWAGERMINKMDIALEDCENK